VDMLLNRGKRWSIWLR